MPSIELTETPKPRLMMKVSNPSNKSKQRSSLLLEVEDVDLSNDNRHSISSIVLGGDKRIDDIMFGVMGPRTTALFQKSKNLINPNSLFISHDGSYSNYK